VAQRVLKLRVIEYVEEFRIPVGKFVGSSASLNIILNSFLGFSYSYPAQITSTLEESIRLRD
jgi:hypothetical protein